MKKIFAAAVFSFAVVAQAATFNYSYSPTPEFSISGSFDGIATGDLVTNLSNISVRASFLNAELGGEGAALPYHYDTQVADWVSNGAVVSFSGAHNNFAFIAAKTSNYFRPIDNAYSYVIGYSTYESSIYYFYSYNKVADPYWKLTEVTAVPEPESYALMLAGLGLMAGVARRRKLATAV